MMSFFLFTLLSLLPPAITTHKLLSEKIPVIMAQSDDIDHTKEIFEHTLEGLKEIEPSQWFLKILVVGEGGILFWFYKIIKNEAAQKQFVEGVQGLLNRETIEELTHKRFAMLLNAIGEEVLYVAEGDIKSILKLAKDDRLLLFFKQKNGSEDCFFVTKIEKDAVHATDSNKNQVEIPIKEFFEHKKFSFVVFLSQKDFCDQCKFHPDFCNDKQKRVEKKD
jgi:hypothetical protein